MRLMADSVHPEAVMELMVPPCGLIEQRARHLVVVVLAVEERLLQEDHASQHAA